MEASPDGYCFLVVVQHLDFRGRTPFHLASFALYCHGRRYARDSLPLVPYQHFHDGSQSVYLLDRGKMLRQLTHYRDSAVVYP
jgi:hypothetical protein